MVAVGGMVAYSHFASLPLPPGLADRPASGWGLADKRGGGSGAGAHPLDEEKAAAVVAGDERTRLLGGTDRKVSAKCECAAWKPKRGEWHLVSLAPHFGLPVLHSLPTAVLRSYTRLLHPVIRVRCHNEHGCARSCRLPRPRPVVMTVVECRRTYGHAQGAVLLGCCESRAGPHGGTGPPSCAMGVCMRWNTSVWVSGDTRVIVQRSSCSYSLLAMQ